MKYDEMIQIMEILHKYVPTEEQSCTHTIPSTGDKVDLKVQKAQQILFGGDHLLLLKQGGAKNSELIQLQQQDNFKVFWRVAHNCNSTLG